MQGLTAHYALWTKDGKLQRSNFSGQEQRFPLGFFPEDIQGVLKRVGTGGSLVLWLPRGTLEEWRAPQFPKSDVVARLDVGKLYTPPAPKVSVLGAGETTELPHFIPEGPSAPATAKRSNDGLRYTLLARGTGAVARSDAERLKLIVRGWSFEGLKRRQVLASTHVSLAADSAPAGLGSVLHGLAIGSVARVWLPQARAAEVVPHHSGDLILDIEVVGIEAAK